MHTRHALLPVLIGALVLSATGCKGKSIGLGRGDAPDARLYADVYTWACSHTDTGGELTQWEGVYGFDVTMEYAPDGLVDRSVPESGCSPSLDIFPVDAGANGHDLTTTPSWSNGSEYSGVTQNKGTGFYSAAVLSDQHSCVYPEQLMGDGTTISDADTFSGAQTPALGEVTSVTDGTDGTNTGLVYGTPTDISWEASGWDESWVQIRREKAGALVEGLTCSTTGDSAFSIDDSVWSQLSDALEVDVTNVYVGFGRHDSTITSDGQEIQTWSREMHTAVVQD